MLLYKENIILIRMISSIIQFYILLRKKKKKQFMNRLQLIKMEHPDTGKEIALE